MHLLRSPKVKRVLIVLLTCNILILGVMVYNNSLDKVCFRFVGLEGTSPHIGRRAHFFDCETRFEKIAGYCECFGHYRKHIVFGHEMLRCKDVCQSLYEKKRSIPKRIIQLYPKRKPPVLLERLMRAWKAKNPEYEYLLFDNDEMVKFVETNFEEKVVKAYKRLNIGVMKADFFRVLSVYHLGGIYADSDTYCIIPLKEWIHDEEMIIGEQTL